MFRKKTLVWVVIIVILAPLAGLIGLSLMSKRPENLGAIDGKLAACPSSPNCVSSQAEDEEHGMPPIEFHGKSMDALKEIKQVMTERSRTKLVTESEHYLHYEETSKILRFVDDIEFLVDEENQLIQFRSASRVGRSDLGVNRKRMEEISQILKERFSQ